MVSAESFEAKFDLFERFFDAQFAGVEIGEELAFIHAIDDTFYLSGILNQSLAQLGEESGEQAGGC